MVICPGEYNSKGKLLYRSNQAAWDAMKAMKGQKYTLELHGETHTLWSGFDKTVEEQLVVRRSSLTHKACKAYFVAQGMCDEGAGWPWMKLNLLDADMENGKIFVKTSTSMSGPKQTHDVTMLVADGMLEQRPLAVARVRSTIVASKGEAAGEQFVQTLKDAIEQANELTEKRPEQ
jgi:acetyl-CoA carboxylase beta subunit